MSRILATALVAAAALAGSPAARAQNFLNTDINGMFARQNAQMNAAMAAQQNRIVQGNLNNPQVMAAYRAGVCGPGLTPQQFAYKYAALGGCTPQGYANYNSTSASIAQNEAVARQQYYLAQQNRQAAMNGMFAGQQGIATQRGMQLGGWQYGTLPNGQTWWYR